MGDYVTQDVGTLRLWTLPNFWCHASCDHAVATRVLPLGSASAHVRVPWLADAKAVEGHDYDVERLTPFWQLTSERDWRICERQQRGVTSLVGLRARALSPRARDIDRPRRSL